MRIAIACDHAAVAHKQAVIARLTALGHQVEDFGTNSTDSCDYSDHGYPAVRSVANGTNERGILICGTGIGMSIAANKVPGIRCALIHNLFTAEVTAAHNKPQVIAFGARVVDATTPENQLGQRPRHLSDATHHTRRIKHDKVTHGLSTTHRIALTDKAGTPEYKQIQTMQINPW